MQSVLGHMAPFQFCFKAFRGSDGSIEKVRPSQTLMRFAH